jgi:O-antigen ligase
MPPLLASCITFAAILWLLARERHWRSQYSTGLWIPVGWIAIVGSRPLSSWFGLAPADASSEGSPFDRLIFIALILAGFIILQHRRVSWKSIIGGNKWLFLLLVYLGLSTLWADEPFVSFKRWIKELGNVVMVLVVLSEENPAVAVKSVLFRCSVLLIPTSALLIKYYPELGRYYNPFNWTYSYGGVTTDKNALGMTLFIGTMGLYWGVYDLWQQRSKHWPEVLAHIVLLGICLWLYIQANCATSLTCAALGIGILSAMKMPAFPNALQRIRLWGLLILAVVALLAFAAFNPLQLVTESLGRNLTLTGRTDIWREALQVPLNPLIGAGYCNFWQPEWAETISQALGFYFNLKEAHNGYLEVYLNSGLIGLALIVMVILSGIRNIIAALEPNGSYGAFRLAILAGAILYNVTESAFSGLVLLWVAFMLVVMEPPRSPEAIEINAIEPELEENTPPA